MVMKTIAYQKQGRLGRGHHSFRPKPGYAIVKRVGVDRFGVVGSGIGVGSGWGVAVEGVVWMMMVVVAVALLSRLVFDGIDGVWKLGVVVGLVVVRVN